MRYPDLEGVGFAGRTKLFNCYIYKAKIRVTERVLALVNLEDYNVIRMLDIGTGKGFWIDYFLSKDVKSIVGVDIASNVRTKSLKLGG